MKEERVKKQAGLVVREGGGGGAGEAGQEDPAPKLSTARRVLARPQRRGNVRVRKRRGGRGSGAFVDWLLLLVVFFLVMQLPGEQVGHLSFFTTLCQEVRGSVHAFSVRALHASGDRLRCSSCQIVVGLGSQEDFVVNRRHWGIRPHQTEVNVGGPLHQPSSGASSSVRQDVLRKGFHVHVVRRRGGAP